MVADNNSVDTAQSVNLLRQAQTENSRRAEEMLDKQAAAYERMRADMREQFRFLTTQEQQHSERTQLLQGYYPQAGVTSGFIGGLLPTVAGISGAIAGGRIGYGVGGKAGALIGATAVGIPLAGISSMGIEESMGTAQSAGGRLALQNMQTYGPGAAYAARQNWQHQQGFVDPYQTFMASTVLPANAIAESWGLNPSQFLPGAMDLVSQGIVSSASSDKARSMNDVLKDAAVIFKSIQSFFGSVDIEGLKGQILAMQQAGFTPESMQMLGKGMQASSLAFAPDHIKQQVYGEVIRTGAALSAQGLSAHLGGQAAMYGQSAGRLAYGGLDDFRKLMFRDANALSGAITTGIAAQAVNPFLAAGRGDALAGLVNIGNSFDLTSMSGIRDFKRSMYELSGTMTERDLRQNLGKQVRDLISTYGLDEETAATYALGSEELGAAYIIEKEQRGKTLSKNVASLNRAEIRPLRDAESLLQVMQSPRATKELDRGVQGRMMRYMLRAGSGDGAFETADELNAENAALFSSRTFRRTLVRPIAGVGAAVSAEAASLFREGDDAWIRDRFLNRGGNLGELANTISGISTGYADAALAGARGRSPAVTAALRELATSAGSVQFTSRIREAVASGATTNVTQIQQLARELGLSSVASALADPTSAGALLSAMESENIGGTQEITQAIAGVRSLDMGRDLVETLESSVFRERKTTMGMVGGVISNPWVIASASVGVGVAASAFLTPMGGVKAAMWTSAGLSALGGALSMAGGLSSGAMSKANARMFNQGLYGENAVAMSILSLLPEGFYKDLGIMSLGGMLTPELNKAKQKNAVQTLVNVVYGTCYVLHQEKKDSPSNRKVDEAYVTIQNNASSGLNASTDSQTKDVLSELVTGSPSRLRNVCRIIFDYLEGTSSPHDVMLMTQVVEGVTSTTGFAGAGWNQAVTQLREGMGSEALARDIGVRAVTDRAEAFRSENLVRAVREDVRSTLREANITVTDKDATRIVQAIQRNVGSLSETEQQDSEAILSAAKRAVESVVPGGQVSTKLAENVLAAMEDSSARSRKESETTESTKRLLKNILEDTELSGLLRTIINPAASTP